MFVVRTLVALGLSAAMLLPTTAVARPVLDDTRRSAEKLGKALKEAPERAERASESFIWPVEDHTINTTFSGGHAGIDIESVTGDKIIASRSGTVTFAGDDGDGYGVKVLIKHPGGFETLYSHLSSIVAKKGPIEQGDLVGYVGCTGSCTGDHLHFEISQGGAVTDPAALLN